MPRPTILTETLIAEIVGYVTLGNYPLIAARAAGVADSTFYEWLARGREALGDYRPDRGQTNAKVRNARGMPEVINLYAKLADNIVQAEAHTEARVVGTIVVAAQGNDRAATTFLERRYPQRWRQHVTTEMVGPDGGPIRQEVETSEKPVNVTDTLAGILEAMARAGKLPKEG